MRLLENWLSCNLLSINTVKTKFMIMKNKNKLEIDLDIKIKGEKITKIDKIKYLGLIIDEKLNWESHIQKLNKKLCPIVGALRRSPLLSNKAREMIYNSLILKT